MFYGWVCRLPRTPPPGSGSSPCVLHSASMVTRPCAGRKTGSPSGPGQLCSDSRGWGVGMTLQLLAGPPQRGRCPGQLPLRSQQGAPEQAWTLPSPHWRQQWAACIGAKFLIYLPWLFFGVGRLRNAECCNVCKGAVVERRQPGLLLCLLHLPAALGSPDPLLSWVPCCLLPPRAWDPVVRGCTSGLAGYAAASSCSKQLW